MKGQEDKKKIFINLFKYKTIVLMLKVQKQYQEY